MSPRMWRSERWATRTSRDRQVDPHVVAEEQEAGLDPAGVGEPQQQERGQAPATIRRLKISLEPARMRWTRIRLVRGRSRTGCPMRMMMRSPGSTSFAAEQLALDDLDDVLQAPHLELGDEGAHAPDELDLARHPRVGGEGHDRRRRPVAGHQPGGEAALAEGDDAADAELLGGVDGGGGDHVGHVERGLGARRSRTRRGRARRCAGRGRGPSGWSVCGGSLLSRA